MHSTNSILYTVQQYAFKCACVCLGKKKNNNKIVTDFIGLSISNCLCLTSRSP